MKYISTIGCAPDATFTQAVMTGIASDGGLLLPKTFKKQSLQTLKDKSYPEVAFQVMKNYITENEITLDEFKEIVYRSYSDNFDAKEIVPLVELPECKVAELFHGPTYAFKDVALQFLGNMFEHIINSDRYQHQHHSDPAAVSRSRLNIIGATSGDTGSAAIYGVRGKSNINIAILYPQGRVSKIQELQMTSVDSPNVRTFAVDGTFDDCQALVKSCFADTELKKKLQLGAVNSMNWARVMAQIVYYFYSYVASKTDKPVNFVVPTGNFGNVFAGFCALKMGLPVNKLVIATNENDLLHRFITKGEYSPSTVKFTHSPSMDIQLASNFERLLYYIYKEDHEKTRWAMNRLSSVQLIKFSDEEMEEVRSIFASYSATDYDIEQTIEKVYKKNKYIIDPHTACAFHAAEKLQLDPDNTIVMATAHPAKFYEIVTKVINTEIPMPKPFTMLKNNKLNTIDVPNDINKIKYELQRFFNG